MRPSQGVKGDLGLSIWTRFTTVCKLSRKHYAYPVKCGKCGKCEKIGPPIIGPPFGLCPVVHGRKRCLGFPRGSPKVNRRICFFPTTKNRKGANFL